VTPEQDLMQKIKNLYGETIAKISTASKVPESFTAALIANESGGDPRVKRFESGVLVSIFQVLMGRKAAYGTIGRTDLVQFVSGQSVQPASVPASLPTDTYQRLDSLANSWGLTQILGYHVLEDASPTRQPIALQDPTISITFTNWMLVDFANRFHLDVTKDFEGLFRCWNTGRSTGQTFDPQYVAEGFSRKAIYEALTAEVGS
jgi:hypothetical protein